MKVILTGVNGFLGRKYIELFPDTVGISVRCTNDMRPYYCGSCFNKFNNTDVFIHAGANIYPEDTIDAIKDNVILPLYLLNQLKLLKKIPHIILLSSMSVLGKNGEYKNPEKMSNYSLSKYLMEIISRKFPLLPITIVRFSTIFYGDESKDGLSRMIYNSKKIGNISSINCSRDFIPIDVACTALSKVGMNKEFFNKTINIVSGKITNMIDIAKYLKKKYNTSIHCTSLPNIENVCYEFNDDIMETDSFDLYDKIDNYYNSI